MANESRRMVLKNYSSPLEMASAAVPQPPQGHILLRVGASGVNPLDLKIRAGQAAHAKVNLPFVLGIDVAGTVMARGVGANRFKVGDDVFGMAGGVGAVPGSLSEYMIADETLFSHKPKNLSMKMAAALPLTFITAYEGLIDRARLQKGMKVLIHGGAGGVGSMAIQISKNLGAEVFSTVRQEKKNLVESLGARPIDYEKTSVDEYTRNATSGEGFDIVFDTVGGKTLDDSFAAVKPYSGHVVSALGWGSHSLAPLSFRNATYSGVFTLAPLLTGIGRAHHGEILAIGKSWIESGAVRPIVDPTAFQLEQANEAHQRLISGQAQGKVVISIG